MPAGDLWTARRSPMFFFLSSFAYKYLCLFKCVEITITYIIFMGRVTRVMFDVGGRRFTVRAAVMAVVYRNKDGLRICYEGARWHKTVC